MHPNQAEIAFVTQQDMSDEGLIELIRSHSPDSLQALSTLLQRYENELLRRCFFKLGNSDDAEDAVQETLIRAFEYEVDGKWLEAAMVYEQLAQQSQQPDRSAYLVKVALMYYRGEFHDEIDPFFESLGEQDILQQEKAAES